MDKIPRLQSNYQHILDNFDALSDEDFEITNDEISRYLREINILIQNFRHTKTLSHPHWVDPSLRRLDPQSVRILGWGEVGAVINFQGKAMKLFHYIREIETIYKTDTHYVFPSYLFEGLCSIYINKMLQPHSDCYYKTYGVYMTRGMNDKTVAITFDLLNSLPDKWYSKGSPDLHYILYIVLHNVYILQNVSQFVHGDLKFDNILGKSHSQNVKLSYEDEVITLPTRGYAPVMIDFGFSSFEREGRRVVSAKEPFIPTGSSYDSRQDVARLFWSLVNVRYRNQQSYRDIEDIFLYRAGRLPQRFLEKDDIKNNFIYLVENGLLKDIREVLSGLLTKLQYTTKKQKLNFSKYVDGFNDIIKETRKRVQISRNVSYKNIIYDGIEPYWKHGVYSRKLNIHIVEIKPSAGSKFVNRCCKQSVYDMVKGHEGVAINGSHFDPITSEYFSYYNPNHIENLGTVKITNDHVRIDYLRDKNITDPRVYRPDEQYTQYNTDTFLANPVLVYDKNSVFIDVEKAMRQDELTRYDGWKTGGLYNLGVSEPRTILATKGDVTYFIVIVRSEDERTGASVDQMQDFLVNYLHVDYAINLDGGDSSLMMWNIGGKVYTPLDVVHRKVVSNVIGYLKG